MARSDRLVAALTALALVPIWLFRWFPTQDGPSHLYNAFVLARLGSPSSVVLREFFVANLRPFPNWTTYLLMAPLTRVLPPLVVQQIVLSSCVVAIPASVVLLQKAFGHQTGVMTFLGVILAYNHLLFLGFFNFVLGAALFVATVAVWERRRSIVVLYALLCLTYFTHPLPFAAAVLAIAILAASRKSWRTLIALVPPLAVLAWDAAGRIGAAREYRSFSWHARNLLALQPFVFLTEAHTWIGVAAALLLFAAILVSKNRLQPIALVTAVLFAGYWIAPWGYGAGGWTLGGWINDRLLFLALLTIPAWTEVARRFLPVAVVLVLAHFGLTAVDVARFDAGMHWMAGARASIRPHSTIQQLGGRQETLHVVSYLGLGDDVVNLGDYEARLRDFPIVFRPAVPRRPPDYVLVWNDAHVRNVGGYGVIFRSREARLFARAGP